MPNEIYDHFPIEHTICRDCAARVSRLIIPIDPLDFGITEEELQAMDLKENEELILEQHFCLVLDEELDYLVKDCSQFKDRNNSSFFQNSPFSSGG